MVDITKIFECVFCKIVYWIFRREYWIYLKHFVVSLSQNRFRKYTFLLAVQLCNIVGMIYKVKYTIIENVCRHTLHGKLHFLRLFFNISLNWRNHCILLVSPLLYDSRKCWTFAKYKFAFIIKDSLNTGPMSTVEA